MKKYIDKLCRLAVWCTPDYSGNFIKISGDRYNDIMAYVDTLCSTADMYLEEEGVEILSNEKLPLDDDWYYNAEGRRCLTLRISKIRKKDHEKFVSAMHKLETALTTESAGYWFACARNLHTKK